MNNVLTNIKMANCATFSTSITLFYKYLSNQPSEIDL